MKKINYWYILAILVAIISIILLVLYFRKPSTGGTGQNTPSPGGTMGQNGFGPSENVLFPAFSTDGKSLYYFGDLGIKLKKYDLATKKTAVIYNDDILYTTHAFWSPDRSKVILQNNNPQAKSGLRLLDLNKKTLTDLDANIQSVLWAPDSAKIYFQYVTGDKNELRLGDPNGANAQTLTSLNFPGYAFFWLDNNQKIGYYTPPSDPSGTVLHIFNPADKSTTDLFSDFTFLNCLASPDGSKILYNKITDKSDNTFALAAATSTGKSEKVFDLTTDIARTFWTDEQTVLIAYREENAQIDSLVKINVNNGDKTKVILNNAPNDLRVEYFLRLGNDIYYASNDYLYKL